MLEKMVNGSDISCLSQIVIISSPCAASTFSFRVTTLGVGSHDRDFSITSQKLSMAYNRYRPHIHRTRIKVQWRISVIFTECLQAKRSLSINISPARDVQKKARNSLGAKSPFISSVILPLCTNNDSSNNYSNNRSYGFSLFTAAPPRQRAIRATKLL